MSFGNAFVAGAPGAKGPQQPETQDTSGQSPDPARGTRTPDPAKVGPRSRSQAEAAASMATKRPGRQPTGSSQRSMATPTKLQTLKNSILFLFR